MKKIVIIGGGFAGSLTAKKLENHFEVTLIDTKDYFEFTPGILRTLVKPEHIKKIQVVHSHYLHQATLVREEVKLITNNEVKTDHHSYFYDYLVIASGSKYSTPIKDKNLVITTRAHELRSYFLKLKKSKQVLIIGGGLVGVELASEIVAIYPEKEIILVHTKSELIDRNPKKARDYAKKFLENKGVKIVLNQTVYFKNDKYTTKTIGFKPDIAFLCTGIMPNYEHLSPSCSASLDEKKSLCVNQYLQVNNYQNIFAAGDINSVQEEKTAQAAEKQARVVAENIFRLEHRKNLKEYIPQKKPMVISLGQWVGIFIYKNFVLTGLIPGLLKSVIEWKAMIKYR